MHGLSWWLPEGISTYSGKVDAIFYVILVITGVMFFLVEGAVLFFAFRYRDRADGSRAKYFHGNVKLEIIWTLIPTILLAVLMVKSEQGWTEIKTNMPQNPDLEIEVTAQQFAWNIHYPQSEVTTLNQLHVPVGKKVLVKLTSKDVIHSFFIPTFRLKQDAVPGTNIPLWFEATKTGNYDLVCAEFCGLAHYRMKGYITIETPEEFEKWLDQSKKETEKKGGEDEW
ncbi:MAG: cytochrome c oxidase subunit II [Chlamydiae bacterium]|nr:cytochrome c oxidase subunit II [Chlamydiota bacterium]MBI3277245.1 cytochrome c oxidase subunit II [Chlamydiota bacterium]